MTYWHIDIFNTGDNMNSISTPPPAQHLPPSSSKRPPSSHKKKASSKRRKDLVTVHVSFKHRDSTITDDTKSTVALMVRPNLSLSLTGAYVFFCVLR